jgi:hypothetical protein
MAELKIVWRNPHTVPCATRRRIPKYDLRGEVYRVQELVSPGIPEVWITIFAFEVHHFRPWIRAAELAS